MIIRTAKVNLSSSLYFLIDRGEEMSVYEHEAYLANGELKSLTAYQGDVLLIVNTASGCHFTKQFTGLQALYERYHEQGFHVLAFPSNQFLNQEPKSNREIMTFCETTYHVSFPIFQKIRVNGKEQHPLYRYLTTAQSGLFNKSIKWNFTKFLINRKGQVVKRYAPTVKPEQIQADIEKALLST